MSFKPKFAARKYQPHHIAALVQCTFFTGEGFGSGGLNDPVDLDGMKKCWELYKPAILPVWIAHYPGTRPRAWWLFDSTEPRKRIDGQPHPFTDPTRAALDLYDLFYGMPRFTRTLEDLAAAYESQADYLDRLKLMDKTERKAALEQNLDDVRRPAKSVLMEILAAAGF